MNEKLIRDLYLGKIRPWKSQGFKTETYNKHYEKFCRLYDKLIASLPKKSRKMLEAMLEEYTSADGEVVTDAFVKGFELGMSLTVEGLHSGN